MVRLALGGITLAMLILLVAGAGIGVGGLVPISLPVEQSSHVFFARATINGEGPFWLTVDTGATLTVLDPAAAARLNLAVRDSGTRRYLGVASDATPLATTREATIRIGDAPAFTPATLYVLPVRAAEAALGHRIDGILGADFLQRFVVDFDYGAGAVRLFPPGQVPRLRTEPVGVVLAGNVLTAPATLRLHDGEALAARLLVDTGSSSGVSLNTPFAERHRLEGRPRGDQGRRGLELSVAIGVNGVTARSVMPVAGLTIGRTDMRVPKVAVSRDAVGLSASADFDGMIGSAVLSAFRLVIDFPRARLWLER
jgi:predicted aspartyl protease